MKYSQPYVYQVFLKEEKITQKEQNGKIVNFGKAVNQTGQPKIYILKSEGKIIYVGYTSQSIGARLRGGLSANGKNGYHGYQWKKLVQVDLLVFVFTPEKEEEYKKFVEAIEAELVFTIRNQTGEWLLYQNEIHFNNLYRNRVLALTKEIYEIVKHTL